MTMTDFIENLVVKGWKIAEVKAKEDRERSCWIAPDGTWYNVPFADHEVFAEEVVKTLFPKESPKDFRDSGAILLSHGWLDIHHDWMVGTVVTGSKKMSKQQFDVLYEFFGDEMLFRGWTIPQLYAEAVKGNLI